MKDCKYIFLVGGYSQIPYFEQRIRTEFASQMKIIRPIHPRLSVVDGAAKMCLLINKNRRYIKGRVMARTYCYETSFRIDSINHDEYPDGYIKKNTFNRAGYIKKNTFNRAGGHAYLKGCLRIIARKGDIVFPDQKIKKNDKRWSKNTKNVRITLYSSNHKNPKITENATFLAEYKVTFPDNTNALKITHEFTFNETMNAISYAKGKPNEKFKKTIEYHWRNNSIQ